MMKIHILVSLVDFGTTLRDRRKITYRFDTAPFTTILRYSKAWVAGLSTVFHLSSLKDLEDLCPDCVRNHPIISSGGKIGLSENQKLIIRRSLSTHAIRTFDKDLVRTPATGFVVVCGYQKRDRCELQGQCKTADRVHLD